MPELPEVENVTRTLKRIIGKKIVKVESLTERLREPIQKDLVNKISNKKSLIFIAEVNI
jgi:Formamidopyrimidine-DNA glycosylase